MDNFNDKIKGIILTETDKRLVNLLFNLRKSQEFVYIIFQKLHSEEMKIKMLKIFESGLIDEIMKRKNFSKSDWAILISDKLSKGTTQSKEIDNILIGIG